jgi:6-phosphogluconate dehydrogenase
MQLGVVGLGRMGGNIVRRLARAGHHLVVFDENPDAMAALAGESECAANLADLVAKLKAPRALWLMLPAGEITEQAVTALAVMMSRGDVIIDGGNAFFKDDIRRAAELRRKGIHYVDVGTSGGVWGLERGYCLMIGGEKAIVARLDPIFAALAPGAGAIAETPGRDGRDPRVARGYMHCGGSGAGHFVKMIHNGIEYGLMQAYAEGFDILRHAGADTLPLAQRYAFDLADVAELWRRGSVISSWLLDLTAAALAEDPPLEGYSGFVEDSGEGRWTIMAAIEEAVPADVLSAALYARFRSREPKSFANKLLSAMRAKFGGHVEPKRAPSQTTSG